MDSEVPTDTTTPEEPPECPPESPPERPLESPPVALKWDIIRREKWCDFYEDGLEPLEGPVERVILTMDKDFDNCFTREECVQRLKEMNEYFLKEKLCPYIPYNFVVGNDGNIYEARGWKRKPYKSEEYPEFYDKTLDIAIIGLNGPYEAKIKKRDDSLEIAKLFIKAAVKYKMIAGDFEVRAFNGDRKLF